MDKQLLRRIARLARIKVAPEQEENMISQLSGILKWVGIIQKVELDGEEELNQPVKAQMEVQQWTQDFEEPDAFLRNVKHPIKNKQIVIKSPIKGN